jgi:hypothetical protein
MKSSFELIELLFENFSFNYCMRFDTPFPTPSKVLYLYWVSYIDGIKDHIISTGRFFLGGGGGGGGGRKGLPPNPPNNNKN